MATGDNGVGEGVGVPVVPPTLLLLVVVSIGLEVVGNMSDPLLHATCNDSKAISINNL